MILHWHAVRPASMSTNWLPFWYLGNTVLNMCSLVRTIIDLIDCRRQSIKLFFMQVFLLQDLKNAKGVQGQSWKALRHFQSRKEVVPWHHPSFSMLCPQSTRDKGVEGHWTDLSWGTGVCVVKLSDFVQDSYVWLWDPGVFLIPIPFSFYQELELASHKLAVQNLLHYVVLFSIHHLQ